MVNIKSIYVLFGYDLISSFMSMCLGYNSCALPFLFCLVIYLLPPDHIYFSKPFFFKGSKIYVGYWLATDRNTSSIPSAS